MKYLAIVSIASLFFQVYGNEAYFRELREKVMSPYLNECMCAIDVNEVLVQRWFLYAEFPNDPCFKCFLKCVGTKVGFIDENGIFSVETVIRTYHAPPELVKKCSEDYKDILDTCEAAYKLAYCVVYGDTEAYFRELREKVMSPYINECMCATGVNEILVQRWLLYIAYPDDPCFKCYIKCLAIKAGFIDENGTSLVDTIARKYHPDPKILKNCIEDASDILDVCEKAYTLAYCVVSQMLEKN
ncbi:hypothetical protein FQR65_LT06781 [Abscondita terminalis]|nr:hypothetical protein FQR65_LT06781 [Abscondita terminalis]